MIIEIHQRPSQPTASLNHDVPSDLQASARWQLTPDRESPRRCLQVTDSRSATSGVGADWKDDPMIEASSSLPEAFLQAFVVWQQKQIPKSTRSPFTYNCIAMASRTAARSRSMSSRRDSKRRRGVAIRRLVSLRQAPPPLCGPRSWQGRNARRA
jgi:hypothetical protein